MTKEIGFKIKISGQEVVFANQKALNDALKSTQKLLVESADKGTDAYKALEKQVAGLKETKKQAQRTTRLLQKEMVATGKVSADGYQKLSAQLVVSRTKLKNMLADLELSGKNLRDLPRDARREFQQLQKTVDRLDGSLKNIDGTAGQFGRNVGNYKEAASSLADFVTGGLATGGIAAAVDLSIQAAVAVGEYVADTTQMFFQFRGDVQTLTGFIGEDLDRVTVGVQGIAATFDQDFNEILLTSNALSKQFGINFDESLKIIETGFLAGANSSGELLDIMQEYPTFFEEAGFSAEQMLQIINSQVQAGIFSDKGIDAVKEATLRLREMPKATVEALDAIGLSAEQIQSVIDDRGLAGAIAMVAERLQGLENDSTLMIYADATAGTWRVKFFHSTREYASDAAADADASLASGDQYIITGSREIRIKP